MNDHKSTDLYLKMLTTFAYLYICLCGSCAVGVLVAVENYHLGIVTTSPPPPPIFTWDPATLQSLKNENIFCIMIISNKIIISIQNDNIYSENWWVLALLWSRMARWSGLIRKSCICCSILLNPILGYIILSCCQFWCLFKLLGLKRMWSKTSLKF